MKRFIAVALLTGFIPAAAYAGGGLQGSNVGTAACGEQQARAQSVNTRSHAITEAELFDMAVMDHLARYATAGAFVAYAASRDRGDEVDVDDRQGKFIRVSCFGDSHGVRSP